MADTTTHDSADAAKNVERPEASYFATSKRDTAPWGPQTPLTPATPNDKQTPFWGADSYFPLPLTPGTPATLLNPPGPSTPSEVATLVDHHSRKGSSSYSPYTPGTPATPGTPCESSGLLGRKSSLPKDKDERSAFSWRLRPTIDRFTLGRPPSRRPKRSALAIESTANEIPPVPALPSPAIVEATEPVEEEKPPVFMVTDPLGGDVKFDPFSDPKRSSGSDLDADHPSPSSDHSHSRPSTAGSEFAAQITPATTPSLSGSEQEEIIIETVIEEELPVEEVPPVAPLFEYVDPSIPVVEPDPATTTIPTHSAAPIPTVNHPWSSPPYNIVDRPTPSIRPVFATFKIAISLGVVCSLLIGYGLRFKIVSVGPYSFGMYGLLLIIDFIIQASAATYNRHRVNRLTKRSPVTKGVEALHSRVELPTENPSSLPECSIAVVGYREDDEAWRACLKSLQEQEYPIKHIIGVVDGNDKPDCAMADSFADSFPEDQRLVVHLPVLLSVLYKQKYYETLENLGVAPPTRWQRLRMWFTQEPRAGQAIAHDVAWNHMLNYLHERSAAEGWAKWRGICFTEPHGHKRHAMFTAFVVGAYVLGTKDAMLTTDSDTLVDKKAVTNLMALLFHSPKLAGVTGDVRIWNKKESFLARMSALRYWFAFNVERACQSGFGCVGCLSGPLGLYKVSDLMSILGPWILQSFLGKETTFGDDRHLTNRILSLGHKTGYTHLAFCDSDTPAGYVRWVKQQTRWSKSFFREAFWFPKSFAYHEFWLTVETTKQFLYPMILTATVLSMLYKPGDLLRPAIWLATMFGVATIKSLYGVIAEGDPYYLLFGAYGCMYFFGLLPSKLFACFTVHITTWGTSARSKSEFARPESFLSRSQHVGHLAVWYLALCFGIGFFFFQRLGFSLFMLLGLLALFPICHTYSDVVIGETKYAIFMFKKWRQNRRSAVDVDENVRTRFRVIRTRRRLVKVPAPKQGEVDPFAEKVHESADATIPSAEPGTAEVAVNDLPILHASDGPENRISVISDGSSIKFASSDDESSKRLSHGSLHSDTGSAASSMAHTLDSQSSHGHTSVDIPLRNDKGEALGSVSVPLLGFGHHHHPDLSLPELLTMLRDASVVVPENANIPVLAKAPPPVPPTIPSKGKKSEKFAFQRSSVDMGSSDGKSTPSILDPAFDKLEYFEPSLAYQDSDRMSLAPSLIDSPLATPEQEMPPRLGSAAGGRTVKRSLSSKLPMRRRFRETVPRTPGPLGA